MSTIAYGDHPDQVADLQVPTGRPPDPGWPVVVLVHGGFWRASYGRDLMAPLAVDLVGRGYATWNLEYRRVGGGGGWPQTLTDVAAAVDHLAAVEEVALDLRRVAVVGHSAGGHLALWVAGRARLPPGAPGGRPAVVVSAAVGQAPVADLTAALHLSGGAVADLLGGGPEQVPERYAVADPVGLVGHGVPVLLVHGGHDEDVPVDQSHRYADAARRAGDPVTVQVVSGDHYVVIDPSSAAWAGVIDYLDDTEVAGP